MKRNRVTFAAISHS